MNDASSPQTSLKQQRLVALIEFAKESAKLRGKPASAVAEHKVFALWEHDVQGRPGIDLNVERDEGTDEVWLAVKRLHENKPLGPQSGIDPFPWTPSERWTRWHAWGHATPAAS